MVDRRAIAIVIISIRRVGTPMVVARLMYPASVLVSCSLGLDIPRRAPPHAGVYTRVLYRANDATSDLPTRVSIFHVHPHVIKLLESRSRMSFDATGPFLYLTAHNHNPGPVLLVADDDDIAADFLRFRSANRRRPTTFVGTICENYRARL